MIKIFFGNSLNAVPWKNIKLNHSVYKKETLVFIHKESSIFSFDFAVSVVVEDNGISINRDNILVLLYQYCWFSLIDIQLLDENIINH